MLGVSRNLSQRAAPHARLVLAAWRSCAGFVPAPPTAAAAATLTIVRVTRRMVDIVNIVVRNCQHIRPRKVNIMRVTRRMVDIVNILEMVNMLEIVHTSENVNISGQERSTLFKQYCR